MKKILCIGSVTTDVIVTPADTIPDPGTLRYVNSVSSHVGGCASNAAMDLAKLGVPVALSCKVGKDIFGSFVKDSAAAVGVDISGVVEDETVGTTVSVVCVGSNGERSFLYNPASTSAFVAEDIPDALVDSCDIIFVAGAMLLTAFDGKPCADFMKKCQEKGKYTVMDTAWDSEDVWLPKVRDVLPYLDLFMPSIEEASKLTGETDVHRIADRLFEMGAKNVIVKWGKHGALVCPAGEERMVLPTYLEMYISMPLILQQLQEKVEERITYADFAQLESLPECHVIFMDMTEKLATALVGTVNLLNPQHIFIGHEGIWIPDTYLERLEDLINRRILASGHEHILVMRSAFGTQSPLLGSVCSIYHELFSGHPLRIL